jgi:hypothetical protein
MTVVCAWCGVTLQRGDGDVSHGICTACSKAVESRFVSNWPRPAAHRPARRRRMMLPTLPLPGFGMDALDVAPAAG